MIGSLGSVVFVASQATIRTIQEFTRNGGSRYAVHEILNQKPKAQWIGPGLDTVSFSMRFDASYGLNPRKELNQLVELERAGKALPLTIGGEGMGVYLWTITSLEQKWDHIDNQGNLLIASANISLKEYVK
ncbi:phage tail protein [Brevibacillus nitrificans]|uniref:phage tail protein n=1 Tax=Brevibacillus nitrificans TaxID=651560 RepID=UPI00285DC53B|nr:phage tail protein [Brevibacillus nitrificans]MDR7318922.1 phage protein U [Brevibacillus nitrificans]